MPAAASPTPSEHPTSASRDKEMARYRGQVYGIMAYYFILLVIIMVLVFDFWVADFSLLRRLGVSDTLLRAALFSTLSSSLLGGALGCILYNIRQLFYYYARVSQYDPRWLGKYITGPLEGALLALVVYALVQGGLVAFHPATLATAQVAENVQALLDSARTTSTLAAFGLGFLVGFGTRNVVGWLQTLVDAMFGEKKVPAPESLPAKKEEVGALWEEGGPGLPADGQ